MAHREIADVIGANVRRLRESRGWTQAHLARRVRAQRPCLRPKWSPGTIGLIETGGQRADRYADILALGWAFRCEHSELFEPIGDVTAVSLGGEPVDLSYIQSLSRGMLPDEEGEDSTYYSAEEDPYDMARIARSAGVDGVGMFRMVTYAVFGRPNFIELRDERAGIALTGGTRANISARRAAASRIMLAEIREAIGLVGVDALVSRAVTAMTEAAK